MHRNISNTTPNYPFAGISPHIQAPGPGLLSDSPGSCQAINLFIQGQCDPGAIFGIRTDTKNSGLWRQTGIRTIKCDFITV